LFELYNIEETADAVFFVWGLAIGVWLSAISCQQSAVSYQLEAL
jgi:hypothetical protein